MSLVFCFFKKKYGQIYQDNKHKYVLMRMFMETTPVFSEF